MTAEQLMLALDEEHAYEIELDSRTYQVEGGVLESTEEYLHAMVAVDDGSLPASWCRKLKASSALKRFGTS